MRYGNDSTGKALGEMEANGWALHRGDKDWLRTELIEL